MICLFLYLEIFAILNLQFLSYSADGGQFLLVEEITQIHYTMYTDLPQINWQTFMVRARFEPTLLVGEKPRGMRPTS
jgi:hypothetical protein